MKKSAKLVSLLLAAMLIVAALSACGGGSTAKPADNAPAAPAANDNTEATPTEAAPAEPENYLDITGVDFSSPSIVIAADDYDGMQDFAKKMQNCEIQAGTIVEVSGIVGPSMMTHTINVPNADKSQSIGTTYEVVGDVEFPDDGTPIHIVGVARMGEYFMVLVVPADQFSVTAE